jgi:hypothetical protein
LQVSRHPVAIFANKIGEYTTAIQDGAFLAIEALVLSRSYDLQPVHAMFQAKARAFSSALDSCLDGRAGRDGDRACGARSTGDARD